MVIEDSGLGARGEWMRDHLRDLADASRDACDARPREDADGTVRPGRAELQAEVRRG